MPLIFTFILKCFGYKPLRHNLVCPWGYMVQGEEQSFQICPLMGALNRQTRGSCCCYAIVETRMLRLKRTEGYRDQNNLDSDSITLKKKKIS